MRLKIERVSEVLRAQAHSISIVHAIYSGLERLAENSMQIIFWHFSLANRNSNLLSQKHSCSRYLLVREICELIHFRNVQRIGFSQTSSFPNQRKIPISGSSYPHIISQKWKLFDILGIISAMLKGILQQFELFNIWLVYLKSI